MPRYVTPDVVEQARKVDLLSYFQATAPNELVRCGAEEYCTREHDSLKISHGCASRYESSASRPNNASAET